MNIFVPKYGENGMAFVWEEGFSIKCSIDTNAVKIEANKEGLISLARHLLELAQDDVPECVHMHFDEYNSLDYYSAELIIVKRN